MDATGDEMMMILMCGGSDDLARIDFRCGMGRFDDGGDENSR